MKAVKKKKAKVDVYNRWFRFLDHHYPMNVWVAFATPFKKVKKHFLENIPSISKGWVKDMEEYAESDGCEGFCSRRGNDIIIWTHTKDPIILSHEIIHATFHILDDAGVKSHNGNSEAFCYLHDHLMRQTLSKFKKETK